MHSHSGVTRTNFLRWTSMAFGLFAAILGAGVLFEWLVVGPTFLAIHTSGPMRPMSALLFVLAGVSLCLGGLQQPRCLGISRGLGALVGVLALYLITERFFDFGQPLEYIFFPFLEPPSRYGQLAPPTVLNSASLLLVGAALCGLETETRSARRPSEFVGGAVALLPFLAVLGYVNGLGALSGPATDLGLPVTASFALLLMGVGILIARPGRGWMALVISDAPGGVIMRRLLPIAFVIMPLLGCLRPLGEWAGLYGAATADAITAIGAIAITLVFGGWCAVALNRLDRRRMQAEEGLRVSEHRFRGLLEAAPDAVVISDRQGRIVLVNDRAERMFGYDRRDLVGEPIERLLPEVRRSEAGEAGNPPVPDRRSQPLGNGVERSGLHRDGRMIPVEISFSPTEDPQGLLVTAIIRDVTERKQAQVAMARLAAVVQASDDAIINMDLEGNVIDWNPGAERMYGFSAAEMLGCSIGKGLPLDQVNAFMAMRSLLVSGGRVDPYETQWRIHGGRICDALVTICPLRDAGGAIIGASSITHDVTMFKRALQDVAQRTAELRQAEELSQLKDHFLSTLSHEMKTPLTLIRGYTELIEERYPDERLIDGIQDGSRRLAEHIGNMLDYSALLGDAMPLYQTEVCLEEVIEVVSQKFAFAGLPSPVTISVDVGLEAPSIPGDPRRIAQMLEALLDNALKFTPPGGTVGIRVRRGLGQVRIEVWDTGPGIPQHEHPRIWEAFAQLATGDVRIKGGLGLGLTIVKKLAKLHGGDVEVTSEPGIGSCFALCLPCPEEDCLFPAPVVAAGPLDRHSP